MASLNSGAWSAVTLARQPQPLPADANDWHALSSETVLAKLVP